MFLCKDFLFVVIFLRGLIITTFHYNIIKSIMSVIVLLQEVKHLIRFSICKKKNVFIQIARVYKNITFSLKTFLDNAKFWSVKNKQTYGLQSTVTMPNKYTKTLIKSDSNRGQNWSVREGRACQIVWTE